MNNTRANRQRPGTLHNTAAWLTETLFIVRVSGVSKLDDLRSLHERTFQLYVGFPGVTRFREVGVEVLDNPDLLEGTKRYSLPDGGRAVLCHADGSYLLLILGSAAASNLAVSEERDPTENAVQILFKSVLQQLRPREVCTGPFDRLVRAYKFDYGTYELFRSNTIRLRYEGGSINMREEEAQSNWRRCSTEAINAYVLLMRRLGSGMASSCRIGKWPTSPALTPPGFTTDSSRRLVVFPDEAAAVTKGIELLADHSLTVTQRAERMTQLGLVPRRLRKGEPHRPGGVPRGPHAEERRVQAWMETFTRLLPDLAAGKYVHRREQPRSVDAVHAGARREYYDDGSYSHVFIFDVPDAFGHIPEATLAAAVTTGVMHNLRAGRPGSAYSYELEVRAEARRIFDAAERNSDEYEEVVRWGAIDGSLIGDAHQSGLERTDAILRHIRALETDNGHVAGRAPGQRRQLIFAETPAYIGVDGHEWKIRTIPGYYVVHRRARDPQLPPHVSLRRAFRVAPTHGPSTRVATLDPIELHRAVATAIATAIEEGAPLSSVQRTAAGLLMSVDEEHKIGAQAAINSTRLELRAAEQRAETATDLLIDTQMRRRRQASSTEPYAQIRNHDGIGAVPDAEIEAHRRRQTEAWSHVEKLRERLAEMEQRATDTGPRPPQIELTDRKLVAHTLAYLATRGSVAGNTARLIGALVTGFRIVDVTGAHVTFSVNVALPGPEGNSEARLLPITGRAPRRGRRDDNDQETWQRMYARVLCTERLEAGDLHSVGGRPGALSKETPDQRVRALAQDHLVELGMPRSSAFQLLSCPVMVTRTIVWRLLNNLQIDTVDLNVTTEFVERVRDVYLQQNQPPEAYGYTKAPRQPVLDRVLQLGGHAAASDLADLPQFRDVARPTVRADTIASVLPRGRAQFLHRATGGSRKRPNRRGHNCDIDGPCYRVRECPHCTDEDHAVLVDMIVWVPEVPGGVLCSRCMREPDDAAVVFPEQYRTLPQMLVAASTAPGWHAGTRVQTGS